jgi:polar amino acid transport system permease protein
LNYHWDFGAVWRHSDLLLAGALGTLQLAGAAFAIAVPLGMVIALLRLARIPVMSTLAVIFIEALRSTPAIVLIYWFFFAFPILAGIEFGTFTAAAIALGVQSSAFFAEVYRGAIQSVAPGQWQAARALGMSDAAVLRDIILPQAALRMIPVFFTRTTELFKATSLAAAIAYGEIVQQASRSVSESFRPIETFTVVALFFFVTIFCASQLVRALERRFARIG